MKKSGEVEMKNKLMLTVLIMGRNERITNTKGAFQ